MTFFILCFFIGLIAARMRSVTTIVAVIFCLIIVSGGAVIISGDITWDTLRMLALGCLIFNLGLFGAIFVFASKN